VFDNSGSIPQQEQEWIEGNSPQEYYEGTPMDCYLPFKLFRSASTEPAYKPRKTHDTRGGSMSAMTMRPDQPNPVNQMSQFVSETAQAMVGFHCQKCLPVRGSGQKLDLFKMETLSDLMKKHKDAFHREYQEFGPVSEWTPDATSSALRVPEAARDLGKHFDLRGELATITHVGRARCRVREPKRPVPIKPVSHVLTAVSAVNGSQLSSFRGTSTAKELTRKDAPKPSVPAAAGIPSSLQGLFFSDCGPRKGCLIVKSEPSIIESN